MKANQFSVAGYPGSKRNLRVEIARRILPAIGWGINEYREPFLGMGSTLPLIYGRFKVLRLNDLHPGVFCVWRSIRDFPVRLQYALNRVWPVESKAKSTYKELSHEMIEAIAHGQIDLHNPEHIVKYGAMKIILHRISFNGLGEIARSVVGGTQQHAISVRHRYNLNKMYKAIEFNHVGMRRCQQVEITCGNGIELVRDQSSRAAIYCDPPYWGAGRKFYPLPFRFSTEDHVRLRDALVASKHWWLCSYDLHPKVFELYAESRLESFGIAHTISHNGYARRGRKKINKEYLISPGHP